VHDVTPALGDYWTDQPPSRTTRPGATGKVYSLRVVPEDDGDLNDEPPRAQSYSDTPPRRSVATRVLSALLIATSIVLAAALTYIVTRSDAMESLSPAVSPPHEMQAGQAATIKAAASPPSEVVQQVQNGSPLPAQPQPAPPAAQPIARPAIPDVVGLVVLIRNAVVALQQANATGNYSVLREIAAPRFQEANSAAQLIEIFADLRSRNLDLGVVTAANPRLYRDPVIDDQGMLRLAGFFPTASEQIDFDLAFQMINGRWRLFGIGVNPSTSTKAPAPGESDTTAQAKPADKPKGKPAAKPTLPDSATAVVLIRSIVIALNQANLTGNYSVLRDISAPGFQQGNSFAQISTVFAELRNRHIDLAPVAAIDPRLFKPATIDKRGMLRLTGFFASRPEQVNFDLAFQKVEEEWRLFGIGLNTSREEASSGAPPASNPETTNVKEPPTTAPPKPRPRPQ
jgi:hypothetical protein